MYLIKVDTSVPYDLFHTWSKEIHDIACAESNEDDPTYVAFADGHDNYLLLLDVAERAKAMTDAALLALDGDAPYDVTAVHCNPAVDMSLTSFREHWKNAAYLSDTFDCAIEDVSLGTVVSELMRCNASIDFFVPYEQAYAPELIRTSEQWTDDFSECPSLYDDEIRQLCMFDNLALPNVDTSTIRSYINQVIVQKGYKEQLFCSHAPKRHTRLELESEMMKCNKNMYLVYKYKKIKNMLDVVASASRSKSEVEHGISGLVYEILCEGVVSCTNTTWCFIDGIWEENSSDGYIWNFLTTQFIEYLMNENADKIALHIMSVTTRGRILKDIKLRLQNDSFSNLIDSKKNLIRMLNGVYDTDTMVLSEPVPSDYVSVRTGVAYHVFDESSYKVQKLMSILSTIFPHQELLDFFILSCSTFLEAYNSPKVFYIWWGEGNNAKSLVQTLVMKTFGEYCSTAPTSLVTGKRTESSNATPELCHIEKKLVVFLQEPNPEERIKAGKIKEMTGNDSMYVRQLFKSGKTMTLKAKIVIVCNNIMEIPGMDAAFRRRIVVIPFVSTFLDTTEYANREMKGTLEPYSSIIDLNVEKNLMDCRSAFMYLLCRRYNEWVNECNMSLDIPDMVKRTTDHYITRNNYPLKFIKNYVHKISARGDFDGTFAPQEGVAITDIYEMYKEWFRRSYPSKRVEDFERFTKELSDEGYKDDDKGVVSNVFLSYSGELN